LPGDIGAAHDANFGPYGRHVLSDDGILVVTIREKAPYVLPPADAAEVVADA
jgi:hypothetical protein